MIASVELGKLFELVWSAAAAGIVISIAFALVIHGATRAADRRRDARRSSPAAMAYGAMALIAAAIVAGSVFFGIAVIVSK